MGWTGCIIWQNPKGKLRVQEAIEQEGLEYDEENRSCKVVGSALVGSVVYLALHYKRNDKAVDKIMGCVVLTQYSGGMFYTKVITEDMGPCESKCPARILNKLSPTDDENSLAWRKRCEDNLKNEKNQLGKLPIGTKIRLHDPNKTIITICKNSKGRRSYKFGFWGITSPQCIEAWGYDVLEIK